MDSGGQTYAGLSNEQPQYGAAGAPGASPATAILIDDDTQTTTSYHQQQQQLPQNQISIPQPVTHAQQIQEAYTSISAEDQWRYDWAMRWDLTPVVVSQELDPNIPGRMRQAIRVTVFGRETHFAYLGNDPVVWERFLQDSHLPGGPQYVEPTPPMQASQQQNASLTDAGLMPPPPVPPRRTPVIARAHAQASASAARAEEVARPAPIAQPPAPTPVPTVGDVHAVSIPPHVPIRESEVPSHPWQDTTIHAPYDPNANQGPHRPEPVAPAQPPPAQVPRASDPRYARILDTIDDQLRRGPR